MDETITRSNLFSELSAQAWRDEVESRQEELKFCQTSLEGTLLGLEDASSALQRLHEKKAVSDNKITGM